MYFIVSVFNGKDASILNSSRFSLSLQTERPVRAVTFHSVFAVAKLYKKQSINTQGEVGWLMEKAGVHKKGTLKISDVIQSTRANENFHEVGAIVLFIGVVRGKTWNNKKVKKLELEAYGEKADEVLRKICGDMTKRNGIVDAQIHHLTGKFKVGEELVYVMVAGAHRDNVFRTVQDAVVRYKKEAPIFKKEYVITKEKKQESYWVSERARGSEREHGSAR